jgi:hypothetical protein
MEDEALPLPSLEEILICNPNTTTEEVRGIKYMYMNLIPLQGGPKAKGTHEHVLIRMHMHMHMYM